MGTVEWSRCRLADVNGIRGFKECKVEVEADVDKDDPDDICRQATFYPSSAVAYRQDDPAVVTLGDCGPLGTAFTDHVAKRAWDTVSTAEEHLQREAAQQNIGAKRMREQFRLSVTTATTPKPNTGPHPYPKNVRDAVGVVKHQETGFKQVFVIQDAAGELHMIRFHRRPIRGGPYSLLRAEAPYTVSSEQALRFTFEAIRAAQQWLLDHNYELALNASISLRERPQVRRSDEEMNEAEEWFDVNVVS